MFANGGQAKKNNCQTRIQIYKSCFYSFIFPEKCGTPSIAKDRDFVEVFSGKGEISNSMRMVS